MNDWVPLKHYSALIEAEMDRQLLEGSGVPVMLQGPVTGVFGPGFAGPTPQGVTLLVPASDYDDARDLLGDDNI